MLRKITLAEKSKTKVSMSYSYRGDRHTTHTHSLSLFSLFALQHPCHPVMTPSHLGDCNLFFLLLLPPNAPVQCQGCPVTSVLPFNFMIYLLIPVPTFPIRTSLSPPSSPSRPLSFPFSVLVRPDHSFSARLLLLISFPLFT